MLEVRTIRFRRDDASDWIRVNPVLAMGEPGYETDTRKFKIGDGEARWIDLPYFNNSANDLDKLAEIEAHIASLQAYDFTDSAIQAAVLSQIRELQDAILDDDGPSFLLLYENRKV